MNKQLSGAAGDVLHALFFRGALVDGDLPSKSGAAELRELGYVITQDTATVFGGDSHFNFLTPAGQEFAISYLADSKFGRRPARSVRELVIKTSIDATELQSTVDEVLDSIRKSDVFKVLSGKTFINDAVIKDGSIRAEWSLNGAFPKSDLRLMEPFGGVPLHINHALEKFSLSDSLRDAVIAAVRDSVKFVEKPTGDEQQSVEFRADRFKVTDGVSESSEPTHREQILRSANAIIEAAKAGHARQEAMMADLASAQAALTEHINQVVNDAIANALRPGGAIHNMLHR